MNININGFNINTNPNQGYNNYYGKNRRRRGSGKVTVINKPWQSLLFCLIFLVVGIGLIIYGINSNATLKEKSARFIETQAIVVDYDYNSDGLAAIVVEYEVNGNKYLKTSSSSSSSPKSIGSVVKIKYNPDNPNDMIWNSNEGIFILIFGSICAIFGGIGTFKSVQKGLSDGFTSGTNETYFYDQSGFYTDNLNNPYDNVPSRFDYSNQANQSVNQTQNSVMNSNYNQQNFAGSSNYDQSINNSFAPGYNSSQNTQQNDQNNNFNNF